MRDKSTGRECDPNPFVQAYIEHRLGREAADARRNLPDANELAPASDCSNRNQRASAASARSSEKQTHMTSPSSPQEIAREREYEADLETIRRELDFQPSAEEQVERRLDSIIRELDEFCAMASNKETADLVEMHSIAVGQIAFRANLILSFFAARKTPALKVVSRG